MFGSRSVENSVPLPPLDASESLIHELDRLSGWLSGLSRSAEISAQLRVLAHVECLANHLSLLAGEMRKNPTQGSLCLQRFALEIPVILKESTSALPSTATASQSGVLSTSYKCIALALTFPCALAPTPCTLDTTAVETVIEVCRGLATQLTKLDNSPSGLATSLSRIADLATQVATRLLILLLVTSDLVPAASKDTLGDSLELAPAAQVLVQSSLSTIRTTLQGFSSALSESENKTSQQEITNMITVSL